MFAFARKTMLLDHRGIFASPCAAEVPEPKPPEPELPPTELFQILGARVSHEFVKSAEMCIFSFKYIFLEWR